MPTPPRNPHHHPRTHPRRRPLRSFTLFIPIPNPTFPQRSHQHGPDPTFRPWPLLPRPNQRTQSTCCNNSGTFTKQHTRPHCCNTIQPIVNQHTRSHCCNTIQRCVSKLTRPTLQWAIPFNSGRNGESSLVGVNEKRPSCHHRGDIRPYRLPRLCASCPIWTPQTCRGAEA